MRLTVDLETLELIESVNNRKRVTRVSVKRGDGVPLEVEFAREGVQTDIGSATFTLVFACKEETKYDGELIVFEDAFALNGTTGRYEGSPSFNTTQLNDLLNSGDADDTNDPDFVDLMSELTWTVDGSAPRTIGTFIVRVFNDVYKDGDGTPAVAPNPDLYVRIPTEGYGPPSGSISGTNTTTPSLEGQWVLVGEKSYLNTTSGFTVAYESPIPERDPDESWAIRDDEGNLLWYYSHGATEATPPECNPASWVGYDVGVDGMPDFELTGTVEATVGQEYHDLTTGEFYRATDDDPMTWALLPQVDPDTGAIVGPVVLTPLTAASAASYVPPAGGIISTEGETLTRSSVIYDLPGFVQLGDGVTPGIALPIVGPRPMKFVYCDTAAAGLGTQANRLPIDPRYDYVITYYGATAAEIGLSGTPAIGQRFTFIRGGGRLETDGADVTPSMFEDTGPSYPVFDFVGHSNVDGNSCRGTFGTGAMLSVMIVPPVAPSAVFGDRSSYPLTMLVMYQQGITWTEP